LETEDGESPNRPMLFGGEPMSKERVFVRNKPWKGVASTRRTAANSGVYGA